jgi:hypothetical protein
LKPVKDVRRMKKRKQNGLRFMKNKFTLIAVYLVLTSCLFLTNLQSADYVPVTIEWVVPTKYKTQNLTGYYFSLESESGVKYKSDIGFCRAHTFSVIPGKKYRISIIPYDSLKNEGPVSNVIEYCHTNKVVVSSLDKPIISIAK